MATFIIAFARKCTNVTALINYCACIHNLNCLGAKFVIKPYKLSFQSPLSMKLNNEMLRFFFVLNAELSFLGLETSDYGRLCVIIKSSIIYVSQQAHFQNAKPLNN